MIVKEREIPIEIIKDKALLRRTPSTIPRRAEIEEKLAKRYAGYYGELAADRELRFLPKDDYHILHDLRLPSPFGPFFYQIDTLILSSYFSLINEIKNILGTLYFEPHFHQLIRTHNGMEDGFKDPITQAKRQKQQLEQLFQRLNISSLPIEYVVAISYASTKIDTKTYNPLSKQKVCYAHRIPEKVKNLHHIHREPMITPKEMKKLCKTLLKLHTPREYAPLDFHKISTTDIITGVQCPKCCSFAMNRKRGTWYCRACTHTSADAHIPALIDYCLLMNTKISNRQLCNFLHLESSNVAKYLLSKLNLSHIGANKGRFYDLSRLLQLLTDTELF